MAMQAPQNITPRGVAIHQRAGVGPLGCGDSNVGGSVRALRSFFVQKSAGRPGSSYELVQKLGEGSFGVAHLVCDKRSGQHRVLKTITKCQSQVTPEQLEHEIRNLKACDHPHIIRLFEYYEDYENIYLIMERAAGGELQQVLQQERKAGRHLSERWVASVIRQCLSAISYVHSMGIIHKDLKCENILLLHEVDVSDTSSQPHAVLIDLGIAELFSARLGRRARCTVVAGTPTHMAPEVWRGNFGPVADVWSLAVVQFELLSGELPFFCNSPNSATEWIRLHKQGPNWSLLSRTTSAARALCQRMLCPDDRMRPTAQQCLSHVWFKGDCASQQVAEPEEKQPSTKQGVADGCASDTVLREKTVAASKIDAALRDYQGRSKFEKAVLLQISSQLHMSQIGRISDVFESIDTDRSGCASIPELTTALLSLGVEPNDAEAFARCLDVDSNERVEYMEFASGCLGLVYGSLRSLLWQGFCVLDTEGTGVLSRADIEAVVVRGDLLERGFFGGGSSPMVDEVLAQLDADCNGNISFEELCRVFLPPPSSLPSLEKKSGDPTGCHNDILAEFPVVVVSPKVRTPPVMLRDEEFNMLLDEIEAATTDQVAAMACSEAATRDGSIFSSRGDSLTRDLSALSFLPAPSPPLTENANPSPSHDRDLLLEGDEELNKMLDDIANS
eukprot:TRINITY_DN5810_c0_g2_i1.p1 TRINITY_DN5810_c0_g2~~TRINITY_DN5810_c0_g2_i1.p1  ORF type:complete len:674 (-),score=96.25 TRINITY_DN5810_c0_g2_i1:149-2170(-)